MADICQKPLIQVKRSLIFPLILIRYTWGLKQIPWKRNRNVPILIEFQTKILIQSNWRANTFYSCNQYTPQRWSRKTGYISNVCVFNVFPYDSFHATHHLDLIYKHYYKSNLIWRTVSRLVDEVIPSDHPRREALTVIQWYGKYDDQGLQTMS